jgi:hypothetical protein
VQESLADLRTTGILNSGVFGGMPGYAALDIAKFNGAVFSLLASRDKDSI